MGECVDETGKVGACPNSGLFFLAILAVTAALCAFITWFTNRVVTALGPGGWRAAAGVAIGLALAAALVLTGYNLVFARV
jgi:hypothetical protein